MKTSFNFQDAVCMFLCCLSVLCRWRPVRTAVDTPFRVSAGSISIPSVLPSAYLDSMFGQHRFISLYFPKISLDAQKCLKVLKHNMCVTEQKSDSLTLCVSPWSDYNQSLTSLQTLPARILFRLFMHFIFSRSEMHIFG